jgi:hypothetical protein
MLSDAAIRDRFIMCLNEVAKDIPLMKIARAIDTRQAYLSTLKKSKSPKVPVLLIARFCDHYKYSPYFIIMGKGSPKATAPLTTEEKQLDLIAALIEALLEVKVKLNDPVKELIEKAQNRKQ